MLRARPRPRSTCTSITSDGLAYGKLSSISVGKNGIVNATYSNGQTIAIYKIAVATFADPDGLAAHSDGMYSSTVTFRHATLQESGSNGAGTIYGSELESSTTDTSEPVQQHDLGAAGLFRGLAGDHDRQQDVRHPDLRR